MATKKTTPRAAKTLTKEQKKKLFIGIEGWLALFIVGICIGILLNIVNLAGYPAVFNDLTSVQNDIPDYVAAARPLLWFEVFVGVISIAFAVIIVVLLGQHKKLAKTLAIVFLASNVFLLLLDYGWAASLFANFNLTDAVSSEMNKAAGDVGRGIIGAAIWIPYFVVSKRVKATLTKD